MFSNSTIYLIKKDLLRYKEPDSHFHWEEVSILSVLLFRTGRAIRNIRFYPLRFILAILHLPFYMFFTLITGIQIPRGCNIGPGLRIYHFGCLVVHRLTVIGNNCTLRPGVIIGNKNAKVDEAPVLGHNVDIGVGAKILGRIRIGNNVTIGANAVVISDVPDDHIAVGVPAKAIPKNRKNKLA
jgi:serine O-acetyltransferase